MDFFSFSHFTLALCFCIYFLFVILVVSEEKRLGLCEKCFYFSLILISIFLVLLLLLLLKKGFPNSKTRKSLATHCVNCWNHHHLRVLSRLAQNRRCVSRKILLLLMMVWCCNRIFWVRRNPPTKSDNLLNLK